MSNNIKNKVMKASKAPKKIYLQENTTTDCYGEWWPEWFEARAKNADIEYTRTDAFIEKACEWLEKNIAEATGIDSYAITESFKQAMEL